MYKSRNHSVRAAITTGVFLLGSLASISASAELSIGMLGGTVGHNTRFNGSTIYYYPPLQSGPIYNYPTNTQDIHANQGAIGILARYMQPMSQPFSLGLETGYVYFDVDQTRERYVITPTMAKSSIESPTETFETKSKGLILLNLVAGYQLVPSVTFNVFAGPAWLNTHYVENDLSNHVSYSAKSSYQLTADAGAEVDWAFCNNQFSAGMRFDYIFPTGSRTVTTIDSLGYNLPVAIKAKSGMTLFSLNLRYLIPGT